VTGDGAAHGPVHQLGPEWTRGPDGLPFRRGARAILLDESDRVLLLRGHDADAPERHWWFTVGGGIGVGESDREAAAREVYEETGLVVGPRELVGPVFTRSAVFDFFAQPCRQDEVFFLARITGAASLTTSGWTDVERRFVDDLVWWDLAALARLEEEIFPEGLPELVTGLLGGWDGTTRHLGGRRP
jgi:8-oxo-dGTP pyrophosphatase MutT (NUDIX family)